ncbi:MAG: TVP38/TMEM64 family protein, partial [Bdellovibrionales bacterium]|nr:TVP38/TMEM64 family protein [Bdellovibrionales bacterium]
MPGSLPLKALLSLLLLLAAVVLIFYGPLSQRLPFSIGETLPWLETYLGTNLFAGGLSYIFLYSIGSVLLFPSAILTFIGGYIFGEYFGTLINLIGATVGATSCYLIGRTFSDYDFIKLIRSKTTLKFPSISRRISGFLKVFLLRLMPAVPFSAVNYGFGLTKVSTSEFALGTFFGLFPKVLIGSCIGAAGRAYRHSVLTSWYDHRIILPVIV